MSQADRILRALERAGDAGVSPTDFALPNIVDGGPPIMRVAARILDLRSRGLAIESTADPNGVARYVLVPAPEPVPIVVQDDGQLVLT